MSRKCVCMYTCARVWVAQDWDDTLSDQLANDLKRQLEIPEIDSWENRGKSSTNYDKR